MGLQQPCWRACAVLNLWPVLLPLLFPSPSVAAPGRSPIYLAHEGHAIKGSYLVALDPAHIEGDVWARLPGYGSARQRRERSQWDVHGEGSHRDLERALGTVALELSDDNLEEVLRDEAVLYIQQDMLLKLDSLVGNLQEINGTLEHGYNWALDRVDQQDLPLDKQPFRERNKVNASGVDVYIVDTGIYPEHSELEGNIDFFYVDPLLDGHEDGAAFDQNGHGTHVAGIVAGHNIGVSNARLKAVKVFGPNGAGDLRAVYYGLGSILHRPDKTRPAVASISLGLPSRAPLLNHMAYRLAADGVTVVVASGNQGMDSCNASPTSAVTVLTVGSEFVCRGGPCGQGVDRVPETSNFGLCTDILAPGMDIQSAYIGSPHSYAQASGTSQAAPFVAGAAALYLGRFSDATPEEVKYAILANSAKDKLAPASLRGNTPNRLLQVCFPHRMKVVPGPNPYGRQHHVAEQVPRWPGVVEHNRSRSQV